MMRSRRPACWGRGAFGPARRLHEPGASARTRRACQVARHGHNAKGAQRQAMGARNRPISEWGKRQRRRPTAGRRRASERQWPGRPMLPLHAWLAAPSWPTALSWLSAGIPAWGSTGAQPALSTARPAEPVSDTAMTETPQPPGATGPQGDERGGIFEVWLQCKLRWLFGAIAAEPVPAKLLRIIEEDAKSGRDNDAQQK